MNKTGPGRPLPPELRNSCQYRLTMTPEVSEQLEALTRHYGKPKSEVLRQCITALFHVLERGKDSPPQQQ